MFGGISLYSEGRIFALIADGELYLKEDNISEPVYDAAGSQPFVYFKDQKPHVIRYWTFASEKWQEFIPFALEMAHLAPVPKRNGKG